VIIDVSAPADKFGAFSPNAQKVLDTVEWKEGYARLQRKNGKTMPSVTVTVCVYPCGTDKGARREAWATLVLCNEPQRRPRFPARGRHDAGRPQKLRDLG